MSIYHHPRIVTDGLVLHLDAANKKSYPGSGTTWYSLTKDKTFSTIYGSPSFNSDHSGYFTFGTSKYVLLGSSSDLRFAFGSNNFTLEAYIYPTNTGYNNIFRTQGSGARAAFGLRQDNTLLRFFYFTSAGSEILTVSNASCIILNKWNYVSISRIGSNFYLYVNALLVSSGSNSNAISPFENNFLLGAYNLGPSEYFNGNISQVKIYNNKGLTSDEILQNFNATKSRYGL